jgi:hypothetical protein
VHKVWVLWLVALASACGLLEMQIPGSMSQELRAGAHRCVWEQTFQVSRMYTWVWAPFCTQEWMEDPVQAPVPTWCFLTKFKFIAGLEWCEMRLSLEEEDLLDSFPGVLQWDVTILTEMSLYITYMTLIYNIDILFKHGYMLPLKT